MKKWILYTTILCLFLIYSSIIYAEDITVTMTNTFCDDYTCNNITELNSDSIVLRTNATINLEFEDTTLDTGKFNYSNSDTSPHEFIDSPQGDRGINFTDDNNRIIFDSNEALDGDHTFTELTMLVYMKYEESSDGSTQDLIDKGTGDAPTSGWAWIFNENGGMSFEYGDGTSTAPEGTNGVSEGVWSCYAITINETNSEVEWYNSSGNFDSDTLNYADVYLNSTEQLHIGSRDSGAGEINATVSRITIDKRAWSSIEVSRWCNNSMGLHKVSEGNVSLMNFTFTGSGNTVNISYLYTGVDDQGSVCVYIHNASSPSWLCDNTTNEPLTTDMSEVFGTAMINITNSTKNPFFEEVSMTLFNVIVPSPDISDFVVLNLTFDNETDLLKDYSSTQQECQLSSGSSAEYLNSTFSKWYGAINMSEDIDDFINCTSNITFNDGIAMEFWVYWIGDPDSQDQGIVQMGEYNGDNHLTIAENNFGMTWQIEADGGRAGDNIGSSDVSNTGEWYHFVGQYNESNFKIWRNGELKINVDQNYGDINWSFGDPMHLCIRRDIQDCQAYLDEFVLYNRSNFTTSEILEKYNEKRLGTPPDLDVFISRINYTLPVDYSSDINCIECNEGQTMYVEYVVKNRGVNDTIGFNVTLYDNRTSNVLNSTIISLNANSNESHTFAWTTVVDSNIHIWNIHLDIEDNLTEETEINNEQTVYIPFKNRPWHHFNLTQWNKTLRHIVYNVSNSESVGYISANRYDGVASDDFSQAWDCDDIDPRGKKGYENAVACFINNWTNPSGKDSCDRVYNHLSGWANLTASTCTNVQAIHEFTWIGKALDLMFPNLTQLQVENWSKSYHDFYQQLADSANLESDNQDLISGDNGKGFGDGMNFGFTLIGMYNQNPSLIGEESDQEYGVDTVQYWINREDAYLESFKNDSWSGYQEKSFYSQYSQYHLTDSYWTRYKNGLMNLSTYQNEICSMGVSYLYWVLDFNYNGNTFMGSNNQFLRVMSMGDSNSYNKVGHGSSIDAGILTLYGLLCEDQDIKNMMFWFRDYYKSKETRDFNADEYSAPESFTHPQLELIAVNKTVEEFMPKFIYDNADDVINIRNNYSFINDTYLIFDGGEERGTGHSNTQGYQIYALGENFLVFGETPYNDDTRMDVHRNGISFQRLSQTVEGTSGVFLDECGNYSYNQYYGMKGCKTPLFSVDYPAYRDFDLQYGGDIEDYIGTDNVHFAGGFIWRPYFNATEPVQEFIIKYGDQVAKRTLVKGNLETELYHNFKTYYEQVNETDSGLNFTLQRGNKNLTTKMVYTNESTEFNYINTSMKYCFAKTSCTGSSQGLGDYGWGYYNFTVPNADFIFTHHWYIEDSESTIVAINDSDKGLLFDLDKNILFDVDHDGISYNNFETDGWGMVYLGTSEIGCFNCTSLNTSTYTIMTSNNRTRVFLEYGTDSYKVTVNTWDDITVSGYDEADTIELSIDTQSLTNNADFAVLKNGVDSVSFTESGTILTFNATTIQNSDYYILSASSQAGLGISDISNAVVSVIKKIKKWWWT